ncbi:condensation domain-containing protein, partial [Streptomyces griseicoloratus]|uniref:condensation domain-containing protein n=1 Tax=Streptomyces griseicoloratus TaxID=2752516 RepID=UPI0028113613
MVLRLSGELNREALGLALRDVIARHEALRTVFPVAEGEPYQQVLDIADLVWDLPVTHVVDGGSAAPVHLLDLDALSWDEAVRELPLVGPMDGTPTGEISPEQLPGAIAGVAGYAFDLAVEVPVRAWLFAVSPEE